jgi:hypothetical protein
VCYKSTLGALLSEEFCEVAAGVFSTAVRPKSFDSDIVLCFGPCSETLVSLEGFILASEKLETSVTQKIISEHHVVYASTDSSNRGWPPQV